MGGGSKGRPKIGDIPQIHPTDDEHDALLRRVIVSKAPTEVAILGISIIETVVNELLRDRLAISSTAHWSRLIRDGGLVGSLSNKIELMHALGLFDSVMKHNLDLARHVRNAFAHAKIPLDFKRAEVTEELEKIMLPPASQRTGMRKELAACRKIKDPQEKYVGLCIVLANALLARRNRGLEATLRNLRRKVKRLEARQLEPYSPFGVLTGETPSLQKLFEEYGSILSPKGRTSDPNPPLGPGLLAMFPAKPAEKKDTENK